MILQEETKINHYKVSTDTDSSYKEDYYYAPIKGEDAKRHREDGPALVYNSKTEKMDYFEWWDQGKMVATFNSKSNKFRTSDNGTFMGLKEVEVPEKFKGIEGSLSLSDVAQCNKLVIIQEQQSDTTQNSKEQTIDKIQQMQEKLRNQEVSPRESLIAAMCR